MSEMKPCPFCGNEHIVVWTDDNPMQCVFYAACREVDCSASVYSLKSVQDARDKWNKRQG